MPSSLSDSADAPKTGRWWTLAAACLGSFALLLNVTIVVVALRSIGTALDSDFEELRWVLNGYTVALATCLLGTGTLADRVGHRRLFVVGLVGFLCASIACAAAPSGWVLVAARIAQGSAAAALFSTGLALIGSSFTGRERSTAFGIWAATVGAATTLGPLLGGAVLEVASWRWIFLMNVPVSVLALIIVGLRVRDTQPGSQRPMDWRGQLLAAGGVFALVFGLTEGGERGWSNTLVLSSLTVGAALISAFIWWQRRVAQPMLPLGLFRERAAVAAAASGFSLHLALFSMLVFLTIYLQAVLGYTALQAGLVTLPTAALSVLIGPLAGRLSDRVTPAFRMAAGLGLIGLGLLTLRGLDPGSTTWVEFMPAFVLAGLGVGVANPAIAEAALSAVGPERSGLASAVNVTFRQLGTAVGIAGLGTVLQLRADARVAELVPGTALEGDSDAVDAASDAAVGRAVELADGARPTVGDALDRVSDVAFSEALGDALLVAAVVALAGAAVAVIALGGRAATAATPESDEIAPARQVDG